MNLKPLALCLTAALALSGAGCRQDQPGTPPAPKPKTSALPSENVVAGVAGSVPETTVTPAGRVPGVSAEDAVITGRVRAALLKTEEVKATEINVETQKGVVELSGLVETHSDLERAVYLAEHVEGVKSVHNRLRLKPS